MAFPKLKVLRSLLDWLNIYARKANSLPNADRDEMAFSQASLARQEIKEAIEDGAI